MWGAALHERSLVAVAAATVAAASLAGAARPEPRLSRSVGASHPSAPTAVAFEAPTRTALRITWRAATDGPRVAGYRLYRDGRNAGSTQHTRATLAGLRCARSYRVAVAAFDAFGNHSPRVVRRGTTAPCAGAGAAAQPPVTPTAPTTPATPATPPPTTLPSTTTTTTPSTTTTTTTLPSPPPPFPALPPAPPAPALTASVFLSPSGSDAGACTQGAPCRSFDRAYRVAQPGQAVEVAGGSYGDQDLRYDATKAGSPAHVTFRPAAGAGVTIGQLDFGPDRVTGGASHVTVQDLTLTGDVSIPGCGVPDGTACPPDSSSPGNDLTFRNLRVKGPYAFYCASCSNVSLLGGTWGPDTYACQSGLGSAHPEIQSAYRQVKRANHILIDGVRWQNFARCTTADHTECLQVEPADDLTIRNSVFTRCDTITVNLANDLANSNSAAGYRAPNNVLIENSVFDEAIDATGGPTYYALNVRECTNCTFRYNSWLQAPRMPNGEVAQNVRFVGNAGPMNQNACLAGVSFVHNVFEGAACSATDRNVADVGFVSRATLDLRLLAGSPAIDAGDGTSYPAADLLGVARPLGGAPDAGAFERS